MGDMSSEALQIENLESWHCNLGVKFMKSLQFCLAMNIV